MCGINGIFAYNASGSAPKEKELMATRDHMAARGPDGSGIWWDTSKRVGFGHRRLAIIDLNDRAKQPMTTPDQRYTITFNGEIYNFPALREELEAGGYQFQTSSDTEALLHLYARDGQAMVHKLRGMFAFAIWDNQERTLFLARDLYGIKPLYISDDGLTFRFASQVKALLAGGGISRDPDAAGIVGFCLLGSVPEPFTTYRAIQSLPAGHTLLVDAAGVRTAACYANIATELTRNAKPPTDNNALNALVRKAALDSVAAHLLADVEVGVFLSAGIDSSALLGLMRDAGQEKIRALTVRFDEFEGTKDDEAPLARQIATYYGAEHIVRTVTQSEFCADIPNILAAMDQPSIDGINTWFVSKAAKEAGLKVALSGVGGDEILAGYPSFTEIPRWSSLLRLPSSVPFAGDLFQFATSGFAKASGQSKLAGLLKYGGTYAGAYLLRRGLFLANELDGFLNRETIQLGLARLKPLQHIKAQAMDPDPKHPLSRVASMESSLYLRNQLLRDSDWAGMAHSLEIRSPLVDKSFLTSLAPLVPCFGNRRGKRALALSPSRPLPDDIINRGKSGFGVPVGKWLDQLTGLQAPITSASNKGDASRAWARRLLSA
jgi:asparagine synthase (glutamine-hydrolysing)